MTSNIKTVVEAGKKAIQKKNGIIATLKTELTKERGKTRTITLDMPGNVDVTNFPDIQKVELINPTPVKDIQKVEIINQSKTPDIQKVHVVNEDNGTEEIVKAIKDSVKDQPESHTGIWVPMLVAGAVKGIANVMTKLADIGVKVRQDKTAGPLLVTPVDEYGRVIKGGGSAMMMASLPKSPSPPSSVKGGVMTVVQNTPTAIVTSSIPAVRVTISATLTNAGIVYIGSSDVKQSTGNGAPLTAGGSILININNLNKIFIDGTSNGDSISFLAELP